METDGGPVILRDTQFRTEGSQESRRVDSIIGDAVRIGFDEALAFADSSNEVRVMIKMAAGGNFDSGMLDNVTVA